MISSTEISGLLEQVRFNAQGLVCAIAQDADSGRVLMQAWMNRESLQLTFETGYATYWSRSRQQLWRKGESSGNKQLIKSVQLDCDGDALLLHIEQQGGVACHTGRESCFYRLLENGKWCESEAVRIAPEQLYAK